MRALGLGTLAAEEARLLAQELARFLVRRCEGGHAGWRVLRQLLIEGGAEIPWERCARLAYPPTAARVLEDCAGPGRTPLVRVQHAAAEERARALATHLDAGPLLARLEIRVPATPGPATWAAALAGAVTARSRDQATALLAAGVGGVCLRSPAGDPDRRRAPREPRPGR
jgi:hypothetical protein